MDLTANKKILVIGESCMDTFIYCKANRLCPDVPVPVLNVVEEVRNRGMAMNLYDNLISLGFTYDNCKLWTQDKWDAVTKTRYVHLESNQTFIRVDKNEEKIKRINVKKLIPILKDYDIVVISDYNKGFLTQYDILTICENHDCVFIDTKKKLGMYLANAKYIKINTPEYNHSEEFINSYPKIAAKIIRTDGEKGAYFNKKHFPSKKVEVRDVSGAGDSFLAGLVYQYAKRNKIEESIKFANKCAAKVIQKRGVSNKI